MGSSSFYVLKGDEYGNIIPEEIQRVIEMLSERNENRINILIDLNTLILKELYSGEKIECIDVMIKAGLLERLSRLIVTTHDIVFIKQATHLVGVISTLANAIELRSSNELKKAFIELILEIAIKKNQLCRDSAENVIRSWIRDNGEELEKLLESNMIKNAAKNLSSSYTTLVEKEGILHLLSFIIDEGAELKDMKEINIIAQQLEETANQRSSNTVTWKDASSWEEVACEAIMLQMSIQNMERKRIGLKTITYHQLVVMSSFTKSKAEEKNEELDEFDKKIVDDMLFSPGRFNSYKTEKEKKQYLGEFILTAVQREDVDDPYKITGKILEGSSEEVFKLYQDELDMKKRIADLNKANKEKIEEDK